MGYMCPDCGAFLFPLIDADHNERGQIILEESWKCELCGAIYGADETEWLQQEETD